MSHKRADRVADLIKAELSRLLLRDVADPRIQHVTVTGVKVSDDLRFARVFFVRMGEEGSSWETEEGLRKATGFFRRELGRQLKLRFVPKIEFTFDESFDYGGRIERILTEIHQPMEDRVADAIRASRCLLLMSHLRPDGDAIGSLLALHHVLKGMGKETVVFCQDKVPDIYRFLPGADVIVHVLGPLDRFDTAVLLDCTDPDRVGDEAERVQSIGTLISIDHHLSNGGSLPLSLVDPSASSTGEMLLRLIDRLGVPLTKEVALNIYTALVTDTGSFRYSNTNRNTFTLAARLLEAGADSRMVAEHVFETKALPTVQLLSRALGTLRLSRGGRIGSVVLDHRLMKDVGALPEHAEGIVEQIRSIEGVRAALTYYEMPDGSWKISLRSKGRLNVEQVARVFGGGGHFNAAGCTMAGTIDEVQKQIETALAIHLEDREGKRE